MRKVLLLLLLAGAATPALAAGDPGDRHRDRDGDKSESSEPRQRVRVQRSDSGEPPQVERLRERRSAGDAAPQALIRDGNGNGGNAEVRRQRIERIQHVQQIQQIQPDADEAQGSSADRRALRRERQRTIRPEVVGETQIVRQQDGSPGLRQIERPLPNVMRARTRTPVVSQVPREGTQPPVRVQRQRRDNVVHAQWRSSWRNNHKYDWRDHRRRHRSLFHIGFYYDPFGWSYRPYSIGWRLWPSYFSSRYWIHDPWQYRLPYAPPGYRWIRYWNDAVLVDTWNGEVVDVIYNFFW